MTPISETLHELLVRQGLANGRSAIRPVHANKGPALSTMASSGGVVADAMGGAPHRPTAQTGEKTASRSGMGKTGSTKPPASFQEVGSVSALDPSSADRGPVLFLVASNKCEPTRPQSERLPPLGVGSHLVLIQGGRA